MIATVLLASSVSAGAQMYRWTDSAGKTHYTDTPPPASATDVRRRSGKDGNTAEGTEPYTLQQARKKAPVKLYSTPGCDACTEARNLLNARGVPFTEVSVADPESAADFKKTIGGTSVPALVVGRTVQKGFEESLYHRALDAAGYPKTGVLAPRNQADPANDGEQPDETPPASGPYAPR